MNTALQTQKIRYSLNTFLSSFPSAAILDSQGNILSCKIATPEDLGIFVTLFKTTQKYFKMGPGDFVISNDPTSGASKPLDISFISCWQIGGQSYYLINIVNTSQPTINWSDVLRIPPTPIVQGKHINDTILLAIQSHPQCPPELASLIKKTVVRIQQEINLLQKFYSQTVPLFATANIKSLLQTSEKIFSAFLEEYDGFEQTVDVSLQRNNQIPERLRLKVLISNQAILFDFSGTSSSAGGLPSHFVLGICITSLLQKWQLLDYLNQGVMSKIHITAPKDSLVDERSAKNLQQGYESLPTHLTQMISKVFEHPRASKLV
jgi:N-methylhydantoinase B